MTDTITQKPRALILAFKNHYLNSTDDVFYDVLSNIFEVTFYGPGYTPKEELITDARKIYDTLGPFDACFVHQYVMHNLYSWPQFLRRPSVNQYFAFNEIYFCDHSADFGINYNDIPCKKFLISLRSDCYAFTKKEEDEYKSFDGYWIIPPPEVIPPVSELTNFEGEKFSIQATDRYIDLCAQNAERIIPVAHLMSSEEFVTIPLNKKTIDVSVPGCAYLERRNAYQNLKNAGYNPVKEYQFVKYTRYAMQLSKLHFGATNVGVKFFKSTFRHLIANSRVVFTDGSRVRAPIRKYFEIPAFGSLLAAEKSYNADALGFVDGKNFVECNSKTICDVVAHSLKNDDWTQMMIQSSSDFIRQTHSDVAWTGYFREIYSRISDGTFNGARWEKGTVFCR